MMTCHGIFQLVPQKGRKSDEVDVQGSQLNASTTEISNIPLRDATPGVQVEDTVSQTGEEEPDPCHPCTKEPLAAATLEPDVEVRARPHRQRLPPEMLTYDYLGNPTTRPPITSSCYIRTVGINHFPQPVTLNHVVHATVYITRSVWTSWSIL